MILEKEKKITQLIIRHINIIKSTNRLSFSLNLYAFFLSNNKSVFDLYMNFLSKTTNLKNNSASYYCIGRSEIRFDRDFKATF